jgi:hypothetical protein
MAQADAHATKENAMHARARLLPILVLAVLALGLAAVPAVAEEGPPPRTYEVTITATSFGQPLSPPVVATHRPGVALFEVGELASDGIIAIAEDGNAAPAADALSGSPLVTDVAVLAPIAPLGTRIDVPMAQSVEVTARPGDRLSIAGMLICTNDGFVGVDRLRVPRVGERTVELGTYDAGSEANTEASVDIVDPCSLLGPVDLDGDPNGNNNDGIDTADVIAAHPGIDGAIGELLPAHDWDTAATVTVRRVP